jgi:hypothetical protein
MEVTVARWNWERFKAGEFDVLRMMSPEGLKNVFGKDWEKNAVRLRVEEVEVTKEVTPEAKGDTCG